jgi:hypothetical protein
MYAELQLHGPISEAASEWLGVTRVLEYRAGRGVFAIAHRHRIGIDVSIAMSNGTRKR